MIHARDDYNGRIVDLENKIPEDEPVFLLRGQDMAAPKTVEFWADEAEAIGAKKNIVNAAREQALRMHVWQETRGAKAPDMP